MLDFSQVRKKKISYAQLVADITPSDLRLLTNEMIDEQLRLINNCVDDDVIFNPQDPKARDPYAASEEEKYISWTLGHVIVHATSSSEEAAFLAAELARGVPHREGRSRYEVHWTGIRTIQQCQERLHESRRMRLASLEMWPDIPHLKNTYNSRYGLEVSPVIQFIFGLSHDDSHLDQIADIVHQAMTSREQS